LPPVAEQGRIVTAIRGETAGLNSAISGLEREIDLLHEYQSRLVADVVTGKLDVREAAAKLPEEAAPALVENDAELSSDAETVEEELAL
jgi:type I restriction enzyme S subunit